MENKSIIETGATINLESEDLKIDTKQAVESKSWLFFLIAGLLCLVGGAACLLAALLRPHEMAAELTFPKIPSAATQEDVVYSDLTGEPLADASIKNAPTFCVQVPNGTDGARPHSGLRQAGVIFEAIAEAGITRFAAIFQNPTQAVIGPLRSLRLYYLDWDVPFDCTIVHAGGADDAIQALRAGGYRDLNENYNYMYRGTYGNRLWNNLFTTAYFMKQFNNDRGYTTSEVSGFKRLTPEASGKARIDNLVVEKLNITKSAVGNTSALTARTPSAYFRFGGSASFNVIYNYDIETNTYLRSYESGVAHEVYQCADENLGEKNPEDVCEMSQMSPSVVIAMIVQQRKAEDNYHENITTTGSGDVYIFQNGTMVRGTWNKTSRAEQIKFLDEKGTEILLAPGQTIISAIPTYGSVDY